MTAVQQKNTQKREKVSLFASASSARVPGPVILDRCWCGNDFCATVDTQPKPEGRYDPGHRNVALTPQEGMLILDVVGDKIACVEVLYRDDKRKKLSTVFP